MKKFDNNIVTINQIRETKSAASVKPIIKKDDEKKIVAETKPYDLEYHLKNKGEYIVDLFEAFAEAIQNLAPDIRACVSEKICSIQTKWQQYLQYRNPQ